MAMHLIEDAFVSALWIKSIQAASVGLAADQMQLVHTAWLLPIVSHQRGQRKCLTRGLWLFPHQYGLRKWREFDIVVLKD